MGPEYLVDSNVIIDYFASRLPKQASNFAEQIFNTDFPLSVAVKIEVLGFDHIPQKLSSMEEFVAMATLLPLDEAVTEQTILLRRKHKKLKLGDAIIAATAIVHNLVLITHNTKDFINIARLKVLDLYEL